VTEVAAWATLRGSGTLLARPAHPSQVSQPTSLVGALSKTVPPYHTPCVLSVSPGPHSALRGNRRHSARGRPSAAAVGTPPPLVGTPPPRLSTHYRHSARGRHSARSCRHSTRKPRWQALRPVGFPGTALGTLRGTPRAGHTPPAAVGTPPAGPACRHPASCGGVALGTPRHSARGRHSARSCGHSARRHHFWALRPLASPGAALGTRSAAGTPPADPACTHSAPPPFQAPHSALRGSPPAGGLRPQL
jgi:hypothetical protein